ncbi:MAG: transpeptidase family protein [Desulfuromonadales bacterium]|nr:transpeptidase family protein [Desulfuromonadales bacterium]
MRDEREKWTRLRIRFTGGVFILLFAITIARAFYLQIYDHDRFAKLAEKQYLKVVQLTPYRGTIYDSTNSAFAVTIEMDSLYADPHNIQDIPGTAAALSPILGIPKDDIEKKIRANKGFVWLQRRLEPDIAARVKALNLAGLGFVKEPKRFYPNAEIASNVIGFTGLDPDGLEGIEKKFNGTLLGDTGYMLTERDALGRDIDTKDVVIQKASKGENIVLTIDKNIQYITEKELAKAVINSRAKDGIAIVMEPQTGKILAMADYPTYNPNAVSKASPSDIKNKAITDAFEPGSTFKVFLISAALEEKAISANDSFYCEGGSYRIGNRTIHDTHKHGMLSVSDILKESSNIGAAKIGARLGADRLYSYLREFGFGEKTGVELPGESSGYMRNKSQWYGIDLATISFGQGVSVNALQLATAISAVANGGVLMQPYIVDRIFDNDGNIVQQSEPVARRTIISPAIAKIMAKMMEGVAAEGGTGTEASVAGYKVAGKTGTAQKADPVTHGYSVDKRIGSFAGFVPADNPRLTIYIVIDEPKTSPYGGVVAAPAFSAIANQVLRYLRVAPTQPLKGNKDVIEVKQNVNKPQTDDMVAEEEDETPADGQVLNGLVMANFRGMSMRRVLQIMGKSGLNIKVIGSGRVVDQNPPPGHKISPTDRVWVRLAPSA